METNIILFSALSIGFIHTLVGPDHYLPFVMVSKARNWNTAKTQTITFFCGVGHVLGSVLLGAVGVALGVALKHLELVESIRGELAGWLLIAFGLIYGAWGIRQSRRSATHSHPHLHNGDSQPHVHSHNHFGSHTHVHDDKKSITPWALFVIFVLGPCEPLIPLLMYPAAAGHWSDVWLVAGAFGLVTIGTMMGMVALLSGGLNLIRLDFIERYMHATAGFIIAASGMAINFLGL